MIWITPLLWLVFFIWFGTFQLWIGFMLAVYIPGLLVTEFALPDWKALYKSLIAPAFGMGTLPLLYYILSYLGLTPLRGWVTITLALICAAILWKQNA